MLIALPIWLTGKGLLTSCIFPSPTANKCCFSTKTCNIRIAENMICAIWLWFVFLVHSGDVSLSVLVQNRSALLKLIPWSSLVTYHALVYITQWPLSAMSWIESGGTELEDVLQNCMWCTPPTHGAFSPHERARISQKQRPSEICVEQSLGSQHQLITLQICPLLSRPLADIDIVEPCSMINTFNCYWNKSNCWGN